MTEERSNLDPWSPWTRHLPADYMDPPVWLKLTSLGAEERQRYVTRSLTTGQFFEGEWCPNRSAHHWRPITAETAERLCDEKVLEYRGVRHWLELFGEPPPASDDSGNLDAKLLDTLTGDQQKLLRYLWTKGSASIDKLRRTVWQGKTVSDQAVKQAGYRLGEAIYKHGMAVRVSKNGLLLDKGRQE